MVSTLAMRRKHGDIALTATLRMQMALRRMRVRRVEALRVALELRMVIRLQSFFRWRKLYAQFQHAKRAATSIEAAGRGMLARILRRILAGERKHRLIRLQANWRRYVVWCKWGRRINETFADRRRRRLISALWDRAVCHWVSIRFLPLASPSVSALRSRYRDKSTSVHELARLRPPPCYELGSLGSMSLCPLRHR